MFYWILTSFLCGIALFLLFLFFFYWFYIKELPKHDYIPFKPQFEDFFITPALQDLILNDNYGSVAALNVLLQFLFQELKDSGSVRRYIIRKMTIEFKELLTTKQIGKIIERITARDFSLGTGCPIISSLKLEDYKIDKRKLLIQEFTLLTDIEYKDGFSISVDVDLILGRSAYVHIKVASLKGKARVQFKREPFTHWSFAFVDDPSIEFTATSHFQNREIPQLTALIINQLRRSVRKKHTLPNYKIRFKPFFDQLTQLSKLNLNQNNLDVTSISNGGNKLQPPDSCKYSVGKLVINLQNCDHFSDSLLLNYQDATIFLTISLDSYPLQVLLSKQTSKNDWQIYDVELQRSSLTEQLGITFAETIFLNTNEVVVARLQSNSPASHSNPSIKVFDILVSINGQRVSSLKNTQKLLQKSNHRIKLQFQRPCIRMKNDKKHIKVPKLNQSVSNIDISTSQEGDFVNISTNNEPPLQRRLTKDSANSVESTENCGETTTTSLKQPTISITPSTPTNNSTLQLMVNTRQRLEQKLSSLRKSALPSTSPIAVSTAAANQASSTVTTPTTIPTSISNNNLNTIENNQTPQQPQSTYIATGNTILDFYCAVAENGSEGNQNEIDFINLTTNETNKNDENENRLIYYKKTKKIKIDNNNINYLNFNEKFMFDLNDSTKYVNICLWVSHVNKTKPRCSLIGYVNLPINDINAECWTTMKGETKQTCYFKPIETKASAQSRPHVLSNHPGFDETLTSGAVTLLFEHIMPPPSTSSTDKVDDLSKKSAKNTKTSLVNDSENLNKQQLLIENSKETFNTIKNTVSQVIDNLFEEVKPDSNNNRIQNDDIDKYTHKFVNVQFNETVFCSFCNRKIWFKNAYRCAYCGYIIHIKCYEKAVATNICPRYLKQNEAITIDQTLVNSDLLATPNVKVNLKDDNEAQKSSLESNNDIPRTRNYISHLISGLRQRKLHRHAKTDPNNASNNNLKGDIDDTVIISSINKENENESLNDDLLQQHDNNDVYQDAQVNFICDDKSMGIQLFEDLPLNERKIKLEETLFKYQSTMEMMKRLKQDLTNDLKRHEDTIENKKLREQIKIQMMHLDEQMESVMFLVMQCQIGLDNCQEKIINESKIE